jgi:hypothetical protein
MQDILTSAADQLLTELPIDQEAIDEIRSGVKMEATLAEIARGRIAEEEARVTRSSIEGVGDLIMRVPLTDYLWCMRRWGSDCWADADFKKSILKKNPELKPKNRTPRKPQVLFTGVNV